MTNFRLFHSERVCRLKFDENGRKFSKRVENIVGKREIAPIPQYFQKTCAADTLKQGLVWEEG